MGVSALADVHRVRPRRCQITVRRARHKLVGRRLRDRRIRGRTLICPAQRGPTGHPPRGAQRTAEREARWNPTPNSCGGDRAAFGYGKRDAVLVDALLTVEQAHALGEWVAAHGKHLTTIYLTHGHGDHFFGLGALLERFPTARALATPAVVQRMHRQAEPAIAVNIWGALFPGPLPDRLVIAEELTGKVIELEGRDLVVVELGHTDSDDTTCLHVPSVGLVVAGDAVYNDVHLYFAESKMTLNVFSILILPPKSSSIGCLSCTQRDSIQALCGEAPHPFCPGLLANRCSLSESRAP